VPTPTRTLHPCPTALDTSRVLLPPSTLSAAWDDDEAVQALRNRFVTGSWEEGAKRSGARPQVGGWDPLVLGRMRL
jgi:hypothetical protein